MAAVPTPNIAELVPSVFSCPQPWFLRPFEHICRGKTPLFIAPVTRVIDTYYSLNSCNIESSRSTCSNSQHLAALPKLNIAKLVPSGFSVHKWFLLRSEHIFPRKIPVSVSIESLLSREKI